MPNIDSGTWDNTGQVGTYGGSDPYGTSGGASTQAMAGSSSGTFSQMSGSGVGGVVAAVGNAVGDVMSAEADWKSSAAYDAAAAVALSNENVVKGSVVTQIAQEQRKFEMTMGAQNAQLGAAGFTNGTFVNGTGMSGSGSGYYLGKASTQQFDLTVTNTKAQGYLTEQGYAQQATADEQMAKQANAAASGAMMGAGFSAISAIAQVAAM